MSKEIKLRAIDVFRHTLSDHKALGKVSKEGMQKDAIEKMAGPAIEEAMIKFAIYHTSLAIAKIKKDLLIPLQDLHNVYYSDEFGNGKTGHQLFKEIYPLENII
jgi:hypothetical protein